MKRFAFRLDRVKDLRERQAEVEEEMLRRRQQELDEVERRKAALAEEYDRQEKAAAYSPGDLVALENYRRRVLRLRADLNAAAAECQNRIAEQRERVLEARRKYRLLESLEERKRLEWRRDCDREEQIQADELFLGRWTSPHNDRR
ncbi:MAG: flagellar FliJ family protein [Bryobacteraceae bacterium]|nr:flagellar FliJ family protein [Bryobacteraceae bacterium]